MDELTQKQINRQDFVDNTIYNLVRDLIPSEFEDGDESQVEWDIEWIGDLRDHILELLIRKLEIFPHQVDKFEMAFYPYIVHEE